MATMKYIYWLRHRN